MKNVLKKFGSFVAGSIEMLTICLLSIFTFAFLSSLLDFSTLDGYLYIALFLIGAFVLREIVKSKAYGESPSSKYDKPELKSLSLKITYVSGVLLVSGFMFLSHPILLGLNRTVVERPSDYTTEIFFVELEDYGKSLSPENNLRGVIDVDFLQKFSAEYDKKIECYIFICSLDIEYFVDQAPNFKRFDLIQDELFDYLAILEKQRKIESKKNKTRSFYKHNSTFDEPKKASLKRIGESKKELNLYSKLDWFFWLVALVCSSLFLRKLYIKMQKEYHEYKIDFLKYEGVIS